MCVRTCWAFGTEIPLTSLRGPWQPGSPSSSLCQRLLLRSVPLSGGRVHPLLGAPLVRAASQGAALGVWKTWGRWRVRQSGVPLRGLTLTALSRWGAHSRPQKRRCRGQQLCAGSWWPWSARSCPPGLVLGWRMQIGPRTLRHPKATMRTHHRHTHRATHSCIATLPPVDSHTQSHTRTSLLKHTPRQMLKQQTGHVHACTHAHPRGLLQTHGRPHMAQPDILRQHSTRARARAQTQTHTLSVGSPAPVSLCLSQ